MIRIGARRSPLAVAQAEWVASQLVAAGYECQMVGIDSLGDVDRRRLTEIGGAGIFATAVRDQLLSGRIDVAVHSMKDLPVAPAPGLEIAAIPVREEVRDVLVGLPPEQWTDETVIGTGSPRRAVQLEALARVLGVKITVVPVRGNVDTRLGLVGEGQMHATVLAAAGLLRLGRLDASQVIPGEGSQPVMIGGIAGTLLALDQMLPAASQGALAIEARSAMDAPLREALSSIDHSATRAAVLAERQMLATLEAGCLAPVGAHAIVSASNLTLTAVVGKESSNGDELVRAERQGLVSEASVVGRELAEQLLPLLDEKMD